MRMSRVIVGAGFAVALCGCGGGSPSSGGSNVRTSPLGYTASLSQQDARELVAAGRNRDELDRILLRVTGGPEWAKVITKLILDHNERFRQEVEAKNGPSGVSLEVWGLQRPKHFEDTGPVWFQSDIERALLPEEWHQRIERDRAANTLAVYWEVKPR